MTMGTKCAASTRGVVRMVALSHACVCGKVCAHVSRVPIGNRSIPALGCGAAGSTGREQGGAASGVAAGSPGRSQRPGAQVESSPGAVPALGRGAAGSTGRERGGGRVRRRGRFNRPLAAS